MENITNNLITIENKIYTIRDKQVMLDEELVELYGIVKCDTFKIISQRN